MFAFNGVTLAFYDPYIPGGWAYSTGSVSTNTWTHVAFSVISGTGTFYINGVAAGTAAIGGSLNCTIPVSIGKDSGTTYYDNVVFNGLISNLRVVKGLGVYTTDFTPSTNQLTATQLADTNGNPSAGIGYNETVLLTLQNSTIVDNSAYAYTFTNNNVAAGPLNGNLLFNGVAWEANSFTGTFYGPALSANIVTGNTQPNITSVGTLTSLTVAGDQYFPGPGTGLVGGLSGPGYPVGQFSGTGYLQVEGRSTPAGVDSFTIEAWIRPSTTTSTQRIIYGNEGNDIYVGYDASNQFGLAQTGPSFLLTTSAADAPKINVWSHIAIVREGTGTDQTYIFVNGAKVAQGTVATDFPLGSVSYIGNQFIGEITNLRYVQGIAVYTTNFTPSTTPLTAIQDANTNGNPSAAIPVADGTGFLLQTPNNASYLTDSSYNNSVLSQTGPGVTVSSALGPGSYSGSLYFDGSNQLLYTPSYLGIALGRGQVDWTVEVFVNTDTLTQDGLILANGGFGYTNADYALSVDVNGYVSASISNSVWGNGGIALAIGGNISGNFPLISGTWYHIALVRTGGTLSLYINGTLVASGTITFQMGDQSYLLQIGAIQPSPYNGGAGFKGYISNIRIVRGVALYTGAFTPPTAPLQLIQNVDENGSPSAAIPTMTGAYTTILTLQNSTFKDNSEYQFPITVGDQPNSVTIDYLPSPFTVQPTTFTYTGNGWFSNGNLSANGNISGNYIFGNGYYLTGISGGGGGSNIANGTSNVSIDSADGNVTVGVGGTANVFVVSTTGVTATYYNGDGNGISNIQGSNVSGEVSYAATANSVAVANVSGIGNIATVNLDGSSSNVLYGNGVFAPASGGGGNGTAIVNGTSNVIVELNSNVSTSVAGNANIFVVTGTGANIAGYANVTGNINGSNLLSDGNLYLPNTPTGIVSGTLGQTWTANFDGAGSFVTAPSGITSGSWTIEFWVNPSTVSGNHTMVSSSGVGYPYGFHFWLQNGLLMLDDSGTGQPTFSSITAGTWTHFALVRDSVTGITTVYKDGVVVQDTYTGLGTPGSFIIGNQTSVNWYFAGAMSNFRVVDGIQVYTAAFTPPTLLLEATQTANTNGNPSAAITGTETVLLTFANSTFVDNSSFNYTITPIGTMTTVNQSVPFAGSLQGTLLFNGSRWEISPALNVNGTITATNIGNIAVLNLDGSSSNVLYGNGVFAPGGGGGSGSSISNGTSNVIVELNSNVSTSVAGNANIFVVTGTGANVNGNLTVTNISNLGNVGNVKITGGANGQILQTDGTGNLNWYNKPSGGTGFIYVYTRTSGAVEVQLTNSVLNVVGRSGNIPVPIS